MDGLWGLSNRSEARVCVRTHFFLFCWTEPLSTTSLNSSIGNEKPLTRPSDDSLLNFRCLKYPIVVTFWSIVQLSEKTMDTHWPPVYRSKRMAQVNKSQFYMIDRLTFIFGWKQVPRQMIFQQVPRQMIFQQVPRQMIFQQNLSQIRTSRKNPSSYFIYFLCLYRVCAQNICLECLFNESKQNTDDKAQGGVVFIQQQVHALYRC